MNITINIIGAGNLGKTLGRRFAAHPKYKIQHLWNRTQQSSSQAQAFINAGNATQNLENLSTAQVTFITTPDDVIETTFLSYLEQTQPKPGQYIFHCSGALTSTILNKAKEHGCHVASVHPMRSFADPKLASLRFLGTHCAVEGEPLATAMAVQMFQDIGAVVVLLKDHNKLHYHAAGVFASNYLVTLFAESLQCVRHAGIDNDTALSMMLDLMRETLNNIENTQSPKLSLTGPIQRNDARTVQNHIHALKKTGQDQMYKMLADRSLKISKLTAKQKALMREVLK